MKETTVRKKCNFLHFSENPYENDHFWDFNYFFRARNPLGLYKYSKTSREHERCIFTPEMHLAGGEYNPFGAAGGSVEFFFASKLVQNEIFLKILKIRKNGTFADINFLGVIIIIKNTCSSMGVLFL